MENGHSYQIDVALGRSVMGDRLPIVRHGRVVGERLRYDNRLAMTVLGAIDRRATRVLDPAPVLERYLDYLERQEREKRAIEK